ncbi:hypothetical protein HZA73_00770 [candidate division TA06 bacterium]|nr:hypothetical protein [candidate division TA06 bacterium]
MPNICIYCGKPATTSDHLPPKCFFPKPYPPNLVTVPCCFECNKSFSTDEDYTRLVFATSRSIISNNEIGVKLWEQKAHKTLSKNHKLASEIYQQFKSIDVYWGKIYLGKTPGFKPDMKRIVRIVEKITRGLFYFETKKILDKDTKVIVKMRPKFDNSLATKQLLINLSKSPVGIFGNGVLMYTCAFCDESIQNSVWFLRFLNDDGLTFICFTRS